MISHSNTYAKPHALSKNAFLCGALADEMPLTSIPMELHIINAERCISPMQSIEYLLFVGRTRQMTQDTASGMHQAAAKLMHGYAAMIYSSVGADEIHAKA